MKATITGEGNLIVIPENDTESYALDCWFNNYNHGDNSSTLTIESRTVSVLQEKIKKP